ncbi:MAG: UDP-N-acetylglucosamine 2-epimerase (non-hydrolyzing) [Cytophagaceae bacterium]|nr:UDP-N-acetylglucosamine 2-epimerase (non-hydrolyzing) [Cytophagaceae bacterium]
MKFVTVVGARPQFIKASILSNFFKDSGIVDEITIHTGQHYDDNMSSVFFETLNIPKPKYFLGISNMSHGQMTGQMLLEIEKILMFEKPSLIIVYGDTNSTLAGALAASKLGIKICHIEAGLRSFNNLMPEEINRKITDHLSDLLFSHYLGSVNNLKNEGITKNVFISGDIMKDACLHYAKDNINRSEILSKYKLEQNNYVICTIHRQENTDDLNTLKFLINNLNELSKEIKIVFPIHPRTKKIIRENNILLSSKIIEIDPIDYFDAMRLIKSSKIVLTDSGGLQKEAFYLGKQCITLRTETEWIELVEHGYNILFNRYSQISLLDLYRERCKLEVLDFDLYGDGNCGKMIFDNIIHFVQDEE